SPHALPWWFDSDPVASRFRYGLHRNFLMVCNHFWLHKDHETAIRAFYKVQRTPVGRELDLVMTGDPIDHRRPTHFGQLVELTKELGIARKVHLLRLNPMREQLPQVRASNRLIHLNRSEGRPGGGPVAEAIVFGVPAAVSDIPVTLEIDSGDV